MSDRTISIEDSSCSRYSHPSMQSLERWHAGRLDFESARELESHLMHCDDCAQRYESVLREIEAQAPREQWLSELRRVTWPQFERSSDDSIPSELSAGDQIGAYRVVRRVGQGAMGCVYLATQESPLERQVAIKVLSVYRTGEGFLRRFENEERALAMMTSAGIASVFDTGVLDSGQPYLVMEYVPGCSVTQYCDRNKLDVPSRLRIFVEICEAVQHAHRRGVLHRDLKPHNILVFDSDNGPVAKVIDFGLAKFTSGEEFAARQTRHGAFLGTPAYMSPEAAAGNATAIDTRSDVYSLGAILFELLVGTPPLEDERVSSATHRELLELICDHPIPTPHSRFKAESLEVAARIADQRGVSKEKLARLLAGDLRHVVAMALEKSADKRYVSPNALAEDIRRFLEGKPLLSRRGGTAYQVSRFVIRNRAVCLAAVACLFTLVVGLMLTSVAAYQTQLANDRYEMMLDRANRARDRAIQAERNAETKQQELREALEKSTDALLSRQQMSKSLLQTIADMNPGVGRERVEDIIIRTFGVLQGDPLAAVDEKLELFAQLGRTASDWELSELAMHIFRVRYLTLKAEKGEDHPCTIHADIDFSIALVNGQRYKHAEERLNKLLLHHSELSEAEVIRLRSSLSDAIARRNVFEAIEIQSRNVLQAKRHLSRRDHGRSDAIHRLAIQLDHAGRLEEAAICYDEIVSCHNLHRISKAAILIDYSKLLLRMGHYPKSKQMAEAASAAIRKHKGNLHPQYESAQICVANALDAMERHGEATAIHDAFLWRLERTSRHSPSHRSKLDFMIQRHLKHGEIREARRRIGDKLEWICDLQERDPIQAYLLHHEVRSLIKDSGWGYELRRVQSDSPYCGDWLPMKPPHSSQRRSSYLARNRESI